ncbi:MAG: transcriptional regulator with GAF, ATPase, and Fis domain, partial [Myxococcota bacterium]
EATLGIIGERASDSAIKYMLLVAAFRSDEVTPNHPLPAMLANIQTTGHEVSELVLPPLTESDVCEFIQDSIGSPAPELAKVINQKTLGNPYYVHRFLEETARRDLLRFDPDVGEWRWDLPAIAALESTGNVVDLIRGRLQELPQTTQHALGIAAVVGRTFRIDTVLVATGESLHAQSALLKVLLPAVDSGVIEPVEGAFAAARSVLGETTGKKFCVASLTLAFVHQQVQDAAELLLDKTTKLRAHQRFGRHLLERADGPDSTFRALNHLNSAAAVATDESDRLELVRANIKGAAYAQSSGAYESALAYYSSARTHLPDDAWLIHRHLAFDAGVGQLESLASTGGFEAAEASYGALKKHARGRAERSRLELAMLDLRTRQANYKQAVAHAVSALSAFDVDIPTDAAEVEAAISAAQYRIERRSAGRPAPFVLEMPELDDPEQHRIQEILAAGAIAGFFVEERVGTYMQWLIVDISLEYGISEFTSFGLTRFVGEACDSDGSWTDVTLALVDRFDSIEVSTRVWTFVASRGSRRIGLTGSLELANRALESSLSIGDDKSASLNAIVSVWLHTILGHPIAEVRAALSVAINQAERARFEDFIVDADLYTRCLNTFTGDTPDLSGPANPRPGGGAGRRSRRHADMKARCDNLMGDHANTWRLSNALFEIMESRAMSTFGFLELRLECALAGASVARETGDLTEEHLTALREAKEVLTPWAKDDPDHFGPRLWMVDAELLAIEERYGEAIKCLDQAIDGFSAAGSVRYAAIAFERTSSLLLSIGATRMASVYLHEARRLFARYGARQKVADITAESSALLARYIPGGTQTSSQTQTPQNAVDLDTEAVLQAVQTLSSEVHLDRLLDSLLALLQQNTGADRVALFAPNEDGLWLLAGERTSTGAQSGPTTAVPLDEYTAGAQSVLHYVQRTREVVRIGAAGDDERFARDPYLQDGDVQSVLCVPSVHQGSVVALLYLESRLRRDVFHSGRVALVETLAAQAAIAMRNAGLVARLEDALGSLKDKNESLADYNRALEEDAAVELHGGRAVGESPIYRAMLAKVETAQATETPILLQGEAGTGKEILARLIHSRSSRREGRFVRISCRSLEATPETWARVSMALDGTLYLDDVSSLPAPFQHELLELMKRDDRPRVIASAGTRLRTQVQAKRISETLYYAVSVFPIDVPPLRDRPTDIPLLVDEFLDVLSLKLGRTFVGVTPESADRMRRYHWPGNAQELLNVMERAALVAESDRLEIDDLLSNAVESGAQLGSYQLVERIGAGGMGEVWRARHKLLRRPAAIKLIPWENFGHAEDSEDGAILRKRFEREAQVTAALQSPNTVQLFDYGTSDTGTFYYVMELLVGLDLESAIKSHGPMPVERVIHVLLQACRSLAEAHSNGLVHRDIKAANVYLCRLG